MNSVLKHRHWLPIGLLLLSAQAAANENPAGRTTTGDVGDVLEYAMPVAALIATRVIDDGEGTKEFAYGLGTTLLITHGLKAAVKKERPDGRDNKSFPSSHTAVAMHTAGFIHERYGIKKAWPVYLTAAFVGYSRVHDDRHDEQDVIAGAAIGYLAARYFTTTYNGVTVTPVASADFFGVHIGSRF